MSILKPFQLLEINVISAQDLEPVTRKMKTYATAWVNPRRKLSSRVDSDGHVNPTWNDKFVFRVDEEFLSQDTSAVQIELYALNWFRDPLVGTVRVLVGNLIPPLPSNPSHRNHIGMRFVALQVRRPSGRPQGILNIGVTLLDSTMRSMPLYTQLSASAVGYRDFVGEDENHLNQIQNINHQNLINKKKRAATPGGGGGGTAAATNKPFIIRRTRSERSERVTFDKTSAIDSSILLPIFRSNSNNNKKKGSSSVFEKDANSSILSISNVPPPLLTAAPAPIQENKYKKKASSVISGAEQKKRPTTRQEGKASSVVSDSIISKDESSVIRAKNNSKNNNNDKIKLKPLPMAIGKPVSKQNGYDHHNHHHQHQHNGKFTYGPGPVRSNSIWSDSEVGPSPSEVAAALADQKRYPLEEERSSVLDGWSLNESVEGLRSKLERWRTELPPIYDRTGYGESSTIPSTSQHTRRNNKDGESGMFSCFGNVYGYECQCICGKPPMDRTGRFPATPSPFF